MITDDDRRLVASRLRTAPEHYDDPIQAIKAALQLWDDSTWLEIVSALADYIDVPAEKSTCAVVYCVEESSNYLDDDLYMLHRVFKSYSSAVQYLTDKSLTIDRESRELSNERITSFIPVSSENGRYRTTWYISECEIN